MIPRSANKATRTERMPDMLRSMPSIDCNGNELGGKANDGSENRTSTQALHVIPSIRNSHVSDGPLASRPPSACSGSPVEDLLSKFVNMVDSVDIIASSNVADVSLVGLDTAVEGIKRRPAYRRARDLGRRRGHRGSRTSYCYGRLTGVNKLGIVYPIWKRWPFSNLIFCRFCCPAQNRNGTIEEVKNTQGSTRHTQSIQDESSHKGSRPNSINRHGSKSV